MRRILPCLLLALFLLTGCVNTEVTVKLEGGENGVFTERVGIPKDKLQELGLDFNTISKEGLEQLELTGITVSDVEYVYNGKECVGKELKFRFHSYADLQDKLDRVFAGASNEVENTDDNVNNVLAGVQKEGNILTLKLPRTIFYSGSALESDTPLPDLNATFVVEVGQNQVLESNADEVTGTRYTWKIGVGTEEIYLKYKTHTPLWLMPFLCLMVVGLVVLFVANIRGTAIKSDNKVREEIDNAES